MVRHYCTYFDRNYLLKGLALIRSLQAHDPSHVLWVLCLDEISRVIVQRIGGPTVRALSLHGLEEFDRELLTVRSKRSLVEYYWTLTPATILYAMSQDSSIDQITYLDSDMAFFSSPKPIFDEMGNASVLIHEHRFPSHLSRLKEYGIYNVGLLSFKKTEDGLKVLRWWRERCIEWCHNYIDNGRFGDQKYLDDWTTRFEGVHVLRHVGAGLAPWNHEQYDYRESSDGGLVIQGLPLVFYHYHAFHFVDRALAIPLGDVTYRLPLLVAKHIYAPYMSLINTMYQEVAAVVPEFNFGIQSGKQIDLRAAFVAHHELGPYLKQQGVPGELIPLDSVWSINPCAQLI